VRRGGAVRAAGLAAALVLAAGSAVAWEVRVPVMDAEPVYAPAAPAACGRPVAGPVLAAELAQAMAEDLDLAACPPPERALVGWKVRYRFDGREYRTVMTDHPGKTLAVKVRVQSAPSSPAARALPETRVRVRR
jgi:hypothetical protein